MTVTMHENMGALSTHAQTYGSHYPDLTEEQQRRVLEEWRKGFDARRAPDIEAVRRFVDADHAVRVYLVIANGIAGEGAINYERISMHVDTQADAENPYLEALTDKHALERAFNHARGKSSARDWRVWVAWRVRRRQSIKGVSKTQAKRLAKNVDAWVEQWLKAHGRLVGSVVREGKSMKRYGGAA